MSQKSVHRSSADREGRLSALVPFAASLMMLVGVFEMITGLVALVGDGLYVVRGDHAFAWDLTVWGWSHLVLGLLVGLSGLALYHGRMRVRPIAMVLVGVGAIATFAFLPYYPAWSLLVILLDIVVLGALAVHGRWAARPRS